ncbi:MAG: protein tyrosine phosphatase family protein [Gammaproteobacteria bacterium]|nr:MAG: protein tyrosine phosphatase family protein [Gammaproteobacteria bacterium]
MNSLEAIRNYVRLAPEFGTAGQPRREQFKPVADAGFVSVVNLAMPDHADSIDDEGRLVTELGMNYFHLPVPFAQPTIAHLHRFFALLDAMQGEQLFVHCIMNYRVSAFMYHYLRLRRGLSEQQARSPILERWKMEPQWRAIMRLEADDLQLSRP